MRPIHHHSPLTGRRARRLLAAAAGAVLCLGLLPAVGQAAPDRPAAEAAGAVPGAIPGAAGEQPGNYDSRRDGDARSALAARRAALAANPGDAVRELRRELGAQGIVELDPVTATPRIVTRLDGFLTGPSAQPAADVLFSFLRSRPQVFGLSQAELRLLDLRKEYVDIAGTHHVSFVQTVAGVPVFGNGVKGHVTGDGRLVQIDGAPVADLPVSLGAPRLSAAAARDTAVVDVFGSSRASMASQVGAERRTRFTGGDQAQLVVFQTLGGPRLAWQTLTLREGYLHVVDAATGRVLFRQSLVSKDTGLAWNNYPGAPAGGEQGRRQLTTPGWLPDGSATLDGNIAHVWLDVNDDDAVNPGEEVGPSSPGRFEYPFTDFTAQAADTGCTAVFRCSWDPDVPSSWQANARQNATQMFYLLGVFHDHLASAPIGFTRAAGNFEAVDGDAVQGHAIDGANTAGGLPDGNHVNNANMLTPPDGVPPRMQMYLFHAPGNPADRFIAGNSGDSADVVYHEYAHGLSNRLVVDAAGVSTLGNIQAGSMGEGWSDWYAMDLLAKQGLEPDTAAEGEMRVGEYLTAGGTIRTEPLDCAVGSTSPACPGTPGAGPGGYTYGDFGRVIGRPEVHADGEIWTQTLWDLRTAIGSNNAASLVTRAMELSPANPSFLDMRNSILAADLVLAGGQRQKRIWQVFAARGMGWFAGSVDGDDTRPAEDFSMPPPPDTPRGTLTGTVRDLDTGAPVAGAVVAFGGHASGFAGDYAATTDASGSYTISGILPGTYPKVSARGAGYDPVVQTVTVTAGANALSWTLRRDWAALAGGSAVVGFNGVDYTPFGCGPSSMFDQSQGTGWSTDTVYTGPLTIEPRFVTVRLPVAVNVSQIFINPSNTCGDAGSASTSAYRVETSSDGTTWTLASSGDFGIADRSYHAVPLVGGTAGVRFLRYTMLSTQVVDLGGTCPGPFSGCLFVDSVELGVYGTPS